MLESRLVSNSYQKIPHFIDLGNNFISAREFPILRRYVDIVFASLTENFFDNKDKIKSLAYLNSVQLSYLAFFADGKQKNSALIESFFQKEFSEIEQVHIKQFVSKNLLKKIGDKTFQSTEWVNYLPKKIISVEAKLSDIKNVLNQAEFNSRFSSESYILVPTTMDEKLYKYQDYIKSKNLGVIFSDKNFDINVKKSPLPCKATFSFVFRNMQLQLSKSFLNNPDKWSIHSHKF